MNAKLFLEQTRNKRELEFDAIKVDMDDKEVIEFVFSSAAGDRVRLVLPRDRLKEMVSWKMLWSL